MHPYRVRDKEKLRQCLEASQRVVPHSVRSLAAELGVSHGTIGHLLTGVQQGVSEELASALAEQLGAPFDELFVPAVSESDDIDARRSA